jgi:PAS domain S-box-containing protein
MACSSRGFVASASVFPEVESVTGAGPPAARRTIRRLAEAHGPSEPRPSPPGEAERPVDLPKNSRHPAGVQFVTSDTPSEKGPMTRASDELKRLRSLISDLDAIVWEAEPETLRYTFVSDRAEDILGYRPKDWIATPEFWGDHIHPDDRAATIAFSRAAVARGDDYDVEYRFLGSDGSTIWIRDLVHVVHDERGHPAWLRGLMVDVTDQKMTELRLHEAEEKYRTLVERLPAVVYSETGNAAINTVSYISPQVERILGYAAEEWLRNPELWRSVVHPDDRARVEVQNQRATKSGTPFVSEYRALSRSGETLWFRDEAVPLVDGRGEIVSWQGVLLDITATKRAEQQLARAERRYKALVEQSPVVTYIDVYTNGDDPAQDQPPIYISPQVEELLGYTPKEWTSDAQLWGRILHPEDREWVVTQVRRHGRSTKPYGMEYRLRGKDGNVVWVHDWAIVIRDDEGNPKYWQGVMVDITGEKRSEELEQALEQERMSSDQLREADEMKNTFLQAVSHDLRTPLAAILGMALTLERDDVHLDPDEAKEMAGRIAVNARKLDRLVNDLLDLDRLGRGIVELDLQPVDVGALIWREVAESGVIAQRRVHIDSEPITVMVDEAMVERIIENLLANTVRHTPANTSVWVSVHETDSGVVLSVEDDGPGVPEEQRHAIFQAFRRGPEGTGAGVGVGLALVARFAELHGGRAWVEEREGGGASFKVLLSSGPKAGAEPTPDADGGPESNGEGSSPSEEDHS